MPYKQIKINITKEQLHKALSGKPVSFKKGQFGVGNSYLSLHPSNVKVVEKAAMKGAGCVLHLSPGELLSTAEDMKGEGIFGDIFKGLKSGYKWAKKNVIDTDVYQQNIKPIVRGIVDQGVAMASAYNPNAGKFAALARDKIGKETGAFGVKTRRNKTQKKALLQARGLYLS